MNKLEQIAELVQKSSGRIAAFNDGQIVEFEFERKLASSEFYAIFGLRMADDPERVLWSNEPMRKVIGKDPVPDSWDANEDTKWEMSDFLEAHIHPAVHAVGLNIDRMQCMHGIDGEIPEPEDRTFEVEVYCKVFARVVVEAKDEKDAKNQVLRGGGWWPVGVEFDRHTATDVEVEKINDIT